MEKCTFCVQRLKEAKWTAFKEKNSKIVTDDLVKTACQQVCPADAIAFGNLTDPQSKVGQWRKDDRAYLALGGNPDIGEYGLKTRPNVSYLRDITLHEPAENQHHSANVKVEEGEKA